MKYKCPDCKLVLDKEVNKCPECGYVFKNAKKDFNKNKKVINRSFTIIICIALIALLVGLIYFFMSKSNTSQNKDNKIKEICGTGEYQKNISFSNVIDNYSCTSFVSFLLDNGLNISQANFDELIKLSNENIYEVIYKYSGNDITAYYKNDIKDISYYIFLTNNNLLSILDKKEYQSLLSNSLLGTDFELFKTLLKGNDTLEKRYVWEDAQSYFGEKFSGSKDSLFIVYTDLEIIKKNAEQRPQFVKEYYSYPYNNKVGFVAFYNKDIYNIAYKSGNFDETLKSFGYFLPFVSLKEMKNYISFGGKFYNNSSEKFDSFLIQYLKSRDNNDSEYVEKLKYVISEAKKEGYSIYYSSVLDSFINSTSLSQSTFKYEINKKIYKVLVNQGYTCYSSCQSTKYYK